MAKQSKFLRVPYALAVFGNRERQAVQKVLKTPQIVAGKKAGEFERKIAALFGKKQGLFVNSGSSANLLAFEALGLRKGSEVITPALTFSTTVAPIIKCDLVPVFVDAMPGSYLANIDQVESMITKKTSALMIPSLLGNVPDLARLQKIAKKHKLVLIEDSCDTVGAKIAGKPTGAFTDVSTTSFYASHIITAAGEGGMLCVNDSVFYARARMLSGWGRRSALNESENIRIRYESSVGGMPYDAKFIFAEAGYNMRTTDIAAAFGLAQLTQLAKFARIRRQNFKKLLAFFRAYEMFFELPKQREDVETSWLAFPLTIKKGAPFSRLEIVAWLEEHNIQTRPVFTGNILRQPGFARIARKEHRGGFPVADHIMQNGFVIGCHHGLSQQHIDHVQKTIGAFMSKHTK
ncbi:MAG TPA: aminotransferase class I/II-fold pyridoxal phosphate-dependent enzyme [Candidatus Paceibacterota bacterium]